MGVLDTFNAFLAAFNAQQWDKAASYLTDDFTITTSQGAHSESAGTQQFLAEFKAMFAAAPDFHSTFANPRVDGNTVHGTLQSTGTQTKPIVLPDMPQIPATGKHFTLTGNAVVTVRGDKIATTNINMTSPGMLTQLGVQPPA